MVGRCEVSQPGSVFSPGWKLIAVISARQLLLARCAALHHRSDETRSSEGVLWSVGTDVPDI